MTEGGLCDRGCLRAARLVIRTGTRTVEVCRNHQLWAMNELLAQTGGLPSALSIAHIAYRYDIARTVAVLIADQGPQF